MVQIPIGSRPATSFARFGDLEAEKPTTSVVGLLLDDVEIVALRGKKEPREPGRLKVREMK